MGHGHYTQFLNFQESVPSEADYTPEWIPLHSADSPDFLCRLPFLPQGIRYRRHTLWHAKAGIGRRSDWTALFLASKQLNLLPVLNAYPSYVYLDDTPSLKRSLAPWYDHQTQAHPLVNGYRERQWLRFFRACRGVFAMSQWAADGVVKDYGLPPTRVHVVLPGANLKRWHFYDRAQRPQEQTVRILMVGGEFRRKGGPQLLDWAETTQCRGWELDIVTWEQGLPEWAQKCLGEPQADGSRSGSLAPRLPLVRVHCGLQANTPPLKTLFEQADLFCLPTQADGSSIASLEAMATGLPVIVGAVGGIPELIQDGVTGYLVKPGDAEALANKLETLIEDRSLRLTVGAAARQSCEKYFNVERQLQEIIAVMKRSS